MDEFSYLSVLLSIILGLAVTQILQGFRARMLSHARIRQYWPTRLWAASILLICTQAWWAMFDLRNRHAWEFSQFFVLLALTTLIYLMAGLVFPDFPREEIVDLREHYYAQRKRFFGLLLALMLASIARDLVLNHALPHTTNLIFHGLFMLIALIGIFTANEWYHKAAAILVAVLLVEYITNLFAHLPS